MYKRVLRCGQQRPCQWARRQAQALFWGELTPCIPVMVGCTISYLVLQVISFNAHWRGGKKNAHKKSVTEPSRLPLSEMNWTSTAIPEGYSDLEIKRNTKKHKYNTKKPQTLTPLLLFWQAQTPFTCQKATAPNGVFLVEFWFFHYGSTQSPSPPNNLNTT